MPRWLPLAVACIGLVEATGETLAWFAWDAGYGSPLPLPFEQFLARAATGLGFIAVGVVALRRHGSGRVGVLLSSVGITWFFADLHFIPHALTFTLSILLAGFFQPILGHLAIAFPTGRLRGRPERGIVIAAYGLYFIATLSKLVFWNPADDGCGPPLCQTNLLLVVNNRRLHDLAEQFGIVTSIVVTLTVVVVVLRHWWTASPAGRRALSPVVWSALPVSAVIIAVSLTGTNSQPPLTGLAFVLLPIGFFVGLLRIQLSRAAVGGLVIQLDRLLAPADVRDALAKTLGDPSLEMAYWMPEHHAFVTLDGTAIELPRSESGRAATVLERDGQPTAALIHDAALEDPQLIEAAGAAARLAIENARLHAEIQVQLQEVRASRARIVEATDAERRRIERDLHDGAQQRLVTLTLALSLARTRLSAAGESEMATEFGDALEQLKLALAELRELARGIHPAILTEAGLGAALKSLAVRAPVQVRIDNVPEDRLPAAVEAVAYFFAAEALTNVAKYAGPCSVTLGADYRDGRLHIEVRDDGVGGADVGRGSGLQGLADRVGALNGRFDLYSPAGSGTRLVAEIPCRPDAPADTGARDKDTAQHVH
jgi:signal transduction histidine kinase